jgi:competence protein ComEC
MARLSCVLLLAVACAAGACSGEPSAPDPGNGDPVSQMSVTVLDVGQGDAILIENGRSHVIIDGGPPSAPTSQIIAEARLGGDTIDAMILAVTLPEHYGGLLEYFESRHAITIRRFYENGDPSNDPLLAELRDSVQARAGRGELQRFDADDPCGDGRSICTLALDGGGRMHVMKPLAAGSAADRSIPVKLVGPDSASFAMWLSGDAQHDALRFYESAYATNPGLAVRVVKGNMHGSCRGALRSFLQATGPAWTTFSLSPANASGYVHDQTKALHQELAINWYRTDENGRIQFGTTGQPGDGYGVARELALPNSGGISDAVSDDSACDDL